jgi:hypothetical protein
VGPKSSFREYGWGEAPPPPRTQEPPYPRPKPRQGGSCARKGGMPSPQPKSWKLDLAPTRSLHPKGGGAGRSVGKSRPVSHSSCASASWPSSSWSSSSSAGPSAAISSRDLPTLRPAPHPLGWRGLVGPKSSFREFGWGEAPLPPRTQEPPYPRPRPRQGGSCVRGGGTASPQPNSRKLDLAPTRSLHPKGCGAGRSVGKSRSSSSYSSDSSDSLSSSSVTLVPLQAFNAVGN